MSGLLSAALPVTSGAQEKSPRTAVEVRSKGKITVRQTSEALTPSEEDRLRYVMKRMAIEADTGKAPPNFMRDLGTGRIYVHEPHALPDGVTAAAV